MTTIFDMQICHCLLPKEWQICTHPLPGFATKVDLRQQSGVNIRTIGWLCTDT